MEELAEGIHDVVKNINVSTRKQVDLTIELIGSGIVQWIWQKQLFSFSVVCLDFTI